MINPIIHYLLESSICLIIFTLMYKLLISNQTHFSWIRIYLLGSIFLSLVIPFITISVPWNSDFYSTSTIGKTFLSQINQPETIVAAKSQINSVNTTSPIGIKQILLYVALILYMIGFLFKAISLIKNIKKIRDFIKLNPQIQDNNYTIVTIKEEIPAFSFFHYIFINPAFKNLSTNDFKLIKKHEQIHVNQYHTLDILIMEFISIVYWFNPIVYYIKKRLQEVHEYIVDEKIAGKGEKKKIYAELLLNLASETKLLNLSARFTGENIKRRILMIAKPRTSPVYKLLVFVLIPVTALLLLSFSNSKKTYQQPFTNQQNTTQKSLQYRIGEIIWKGNNVYSSDTLNKVLGFKKGDMYNCENVDECLKNGSIGNLYYDNGYVFYKADLMDNKKPYGEVDITITVYEGMIGKIGTISFQGNTTVPDDEIRKNLEINSGELFNRTKIINSVYSIVKMKKFEPNSIEPIPIPNTEKSTQEYAIIDMLFKVIEIKK